MNIFYNQALRQTQNLKKDLNSFQLSITDNISSTLPLQGKKINTCKKYINFIQLKNPKNCIRPNNSESKFSF